MNKSTFKNVLFINFGGIGDEILFFPTLATFKKNYPDAKVTLMVEPRSASAQYLTNNIDDIIKYDVKTTNKVLAFINLLKLIRQGNYDAVISSGSNKFIAVLLYLSGIKIRVGFNSGPISKKLLTGAPNLNQQQYAANMYHDLLKGINITEKAGLPNIIIPEENIEKAEKLLTKKDKPIITIHPGVSKLSIVKKIIKGWPAEKWVDLIEKLAETQTYTIAICGGPDDEKVIEKIRQEIANRNINPDNIIDLYGKTKNLSELGGIIKLSDVLICVDSAPMHIGVGVETKIAAIFGPTDEKKLLPINDKFKVIKMPSISCRPCLWDSRNEVCQKPVCLNTTVNDVLNAINDLQII